MNGFQTKWIGRKHIHKERTDSTNNDIRLLAMEGAPEGTVVTADMQTAGKGRRGRSWEAEAGSSLLFSLLLRPKLAPDAAPQITLLMAMAVTKAIRRMTGLDAYIKWPNDVVVNRKKVCGILTEMQLKDGGIEYVLVGTGINMNQTSIPEELAGSATSLLLEKDISARLNREEMLGKVLEFFEEYYECFLQSNDVSGLMNEYNSWLASLDKEVKVLDPKGEFTGISKGINEKGELLVTRPNGDVTAIYAGEVSVRGLYGYV